MARTIAPSLQEREEYRRLYRELGDAIDGYYTVCSEGVDETESLQRICISAFRLLWCIRNEFRGLMFVVSASQLLEDTGAAIVAYYSTGNSWQQESDALEILSRVAFREMRAKEAVTNILQHCGLA